ENGLGIGHNHADRAFAVVRLRTVAGLDANRSATHYSSFRALPVAYYLSRSSCRRPGDAASRVSTSKLPALKTVLINDHADSAAATIFKTAYHSSAAIHLHGGFRADDIGGERNRKIDSRTYRHIGIHAEQHTVGGNVLGLDRLSPASSTRV